MYVRALTATVLAATASQAQGQRLDTALRDTLTSDPEIAGADASVRAAEAGVALSRADRFPALDLDTHAGYRTDDPLSGAVRMPTLGLALQFDVPLYTGGALTWRIRAARAALTAEQAQRDLTINTRLADTADLYGGLYRDGRIEAARVAQVEDVTTLLTATRERQRAGAVTETDSYQAVARLAMSKARLAEARAALTRSQEGLRALTGAEITAVEDAEPPVLPPQIVADLPVRIASFPAVRLAEARVAVARAAIRIAAAERAPRLSLSSGLQSANDLTSRLAPPAIFRTGMQIGLTLRVPLFQGGAPAARVRQAEQQLGARQEERTATERQLVAEIRGQFAQLKALDATLPALAKALEASRAALVGVQAEITVGTRSSLDVLNAQEDVTQVAVQIAQLRQQRLALAYAILGMMGQLTPAARDGAPSPVTSAPVRAPLSRAALLHASMRMAVAAPATVPTSPRQAARTRIAGLHYDRLGLWVWQGSQSWSLKPGQRLA